MSILIKIYLNQTQLGSNISGCPLSNVSLNTGSVLDVLSSDNDKYLFVIIN